MVSEIKDIHKIQILNKKTWVVKLMFLVQEFLDIEIQDYCFWIQNYLDKVFKMYNLENCKILSKLVCEGQRDYVLEKWGDNNEEMEITPMPKLWVSSCML
jgi:hypothetical protein